MAQRLWAKALLIERDEGERTGDPADDRELHPSRTQRVGELCGKLAEESGIEPSRFVACCTHTHAGPRLAAQCVYGETPQEHAAHIEQYVRTLGADLARVTAEALAARRPGRLSWARGQVDFAANRRVLREGKWTGFGVQADGPVEHSLLLLRITSAEGKLLGVVANYACHATTLGPSFNQVHGDWPGCAQEYFEAEHSGAMAMILIGCGADANPNPRGELEHARQHGRTVANEIRRLLAGSFTLLPPQLSADKARIALPLAPAPSRAELQRRIEAGQADTDSATARRRAEHAAGILARMDRQESLPTALGYPITVWSFGDRLSMVFLSGEVVVDYALRLHRQLDQQRLWITAYAHRSMPGYIVSRRVLQEGGYEALSSMMPLAPEAEDSLVAGVCRLVPAAFHVGAPAGK